MDVNESPAKARENVKPAVVTPGAVCVFSQTGDAQHDGEIVTVDGSPLTTIAAARAQFVPLGESLAPEAKLLLPGDVVLVPLYDSKGETLLGHVEQVVHVVFAPRVNVTSLEADPRRPDHAADIQRTAYIHQLTTAPKPQCTGSDHPVTGALKR